MTDGDLPLDAILGYFMPSRLYMHLSGTQDEYTPEGASLKQLATSVHEHMHFFQTLMTGYGHIAWDGHRQMTSHLVNEWVALSTNANGKRRLPLAYLATSSPQAFLRAYVAHSTAMEVITLGRARFGLPQRNATLAELGLQLAPHPWLANPTVVINGTMHVLQGKEILEGHAKYVECSFLEVVASVPHDQAWDRTGLPKQYVVALDWFVERCGEGARADFPFLCDLALQTTWNPVIPQTEDEWHASHPSWRFLRLTEAYLHNGREAFGDPQTWHTKYERLAATLLSHAKLAPLEDVSKERLAAFGRKQQLLGFEKLMRDALEFRERHPWCAANPAIDPELWTLMARSFAPPVVEIGGHLVGGGLGSPDANAEVVVELHYQALAMQILGSFSSSAASAGAIECAFSRFGITRGCDFQDSHSCTGRYRPADGAPHPLTIEDNGDFHGCSFEAVLHTLGLASIDLDVDHLARMPTTEELADAERRARDSKD